MNMPDEVFARANENEPVKGKPLVRSRSFWGIALTLASIFAPQLIPIADNFNEITALIGAGIGVWGRVKAGIPITSLFTKS